MLVAGLASVRTEMNNMALSYGKKDSRQLNNESGLWMNYSKKSLTSLMWKTELFLRSSARCMSERKS